MSTARLQVTAANCILGDELRNIATGAAVQATVQQSIIANTQDILRVYGAPPDKYVILFVQALC